MSRLRQLISRAIPQRYKLLYFVRQKARRRGRPAEKLLLRLLCEKRKAAIDVGANIGTISYYLSKYCRENHAFEINPHIADKLRRAKLANTKVYEMGLSDSRGSARLRVPLAGFGAVFGNATIETANNLDGRAVTERELPVAMLDDFDLKDVGIIKIDVEGHELAVLRGAMKTLERERPSLIVEIVERMNGHAFTEIAQLTARLSYGCYRLTGNALVPTAAIEDRRGDNDFYFLQPAVAQAVNGRLKKLGA
ncbi:MAG TPA: FkbM family methyltransferase [Rhizomicrobium sp.]|jgi:FkbM family methyltransferase|nr:FkbM family methyltransferase [Rhizomicrobium sp.]